MWAIGWPLSTRIAMRWTVSSPPHSPKNILVFFLEFQLHQPFADRVKRQSTPRLENLHSSLARTFDSFALCIENSLSLDYPSGSPFSRWVESWFSKRSRTHGTYVFYTVVPSRQPCNLNISPLGNANTHVSRSIHSACVTRRPHSHLTVLSSTLITPETLIACTI